MAGVRRDESLVQNQRRVLEPGIDVAVRPVVGIVGLPIGSLPSFAFREIRFGPLEFLDLEAERTARVSRRAAAASWAANQTLPSTSARSGRPGRSVSRGSTTNGRRSNSMLDFFDGLGGGQLIHGGHGENRLALIDRLIREPALAQPVGLDHRAVVGEAVGRLPADRPR